MNASKGVETRQPIYLIFETPSRAPTNLNLRTTLRETSAKQKQHIEFQFVHRDPLVSDPNFPKHIPCTALLTTPIIGIKSKASRPFMDPCSSIFLSKHTGASCSHCATVQDEYYASYFFYPTNISLFLIRRKTRLAPPLRIDYAARSTSAPVQHCTRSLPRRNSSRCSCSLSCIFRILSRILSFSILLFRGLCGILPGHGFIYFSMHY